ncbi:MAG: zf-HC2 domain-containing protein [Pseudomonadota bacterium]
MTEDPRSVPDEQLSAFLDGELGEAEAARVRAALAADARLAERLAAFQNADRRLIAAYAEEPELAGARALLARAEDELPRKFAFRAVFAGLFARPAFAAAGFAAAGAAAVLLLSELAAPAAGVRFPGAATAPAAVLADALTRTPSGASREFAGGRITPVLSFVAADGAYCREVEIVADGAARAVACRRAEDWTIVLAAEAPLADPSDYVAASGGLDAFDAAVDEIAAAPPLSAEEEEVAMRRGWARP